MSDSSNIGRADALSAGRCTAPNAPLRGGKPGIYLAHMCVVDYGGGRSKQEYNAPALADEDGIAAVQAKAAPGDLLINGALASGGSVILNPPRNVVLDTSNVGNTTQVATIYGLDAVGQAATQQLTANGTTLVVGEQAFSRVDRIALDSALTAGNINVGTGNKIGVPFKIDQNSIFAVLENGVASTPTAINGQQDGVLGTIEFETPPDGNIVYSVLAHVFDNIDYEAVSGGL